MENLPEPFANDRSTARETVTNSLARVRALGIELNAGTLALYESYANGDLTPVQLVAALRKRLEAPPKT